jgi:hypothetical protein
MFGGTLRYLTLRYLVWSTALLLIAASCSGCLGRLIADKGMSDADRAECDALVQAVKNRFNLADFRIPPGLSALVGTKQFPIDGFWPEDEPQSIGCSTRVQGPLLTLYTVVGLWRVTDPKDQETIVTLVREQHRQLIEPKPTVIRFVEREVWLVHRDTSGEVRGYGRGEEKLLKRQVIR